MNTWVSMAWPIKPVEQKVKARGKLKPGKCPHCERPKHITVTGNVTSWCREYKAQVSRNDYNKKKRNPEIEKKIPKHKPGKCAAQQCENSRHITTSGTVTTYCRDHNNARYRAYYSKQKLYVGVASGISQ
jgi:hypothetical protein